MVADIEDLSWEEAPDLLTVREARALLRIGDRQCRELLKEEGLEVRVRGSIRVPKQALQVWVDNQVQEDENQ